MDRSGKSAGNNFAKWCSSHFIFFAGGFFYRFW